MIMIVTAYTNCDPGMRCDGWTKSGIQAHEGIVACGPEWEFGTIVCIQGIGCYECQDTGSAITRDRLDICFQHRQEALQFGIGTYRVRIYAANNISRVLNQGIYYDERALVK